MVTILPDSATTEREWNFRDDNNQNFFGDIPENQQIISLTLNWKPDAASETRLIGRYRIDLRSLLSEGFARKSKRGVNLRFQRTGDIIEIAIDRESPALVVGRKPQKEAHTSRIRLVERERAVCRRARRLAMPGKDSKISS